MRWPACLSPTRKCNTIVLFRLVFVRVVCSPSLPPLGVSSGPLGLSVFIKESVCCERGVTRDN